jgi:hypothetical protein
MSTVRRPGLRCRSTGVHGFHKTWATHPPMKGADWSMRTIFLDYNLERSSWFRRSAMILLQLGDALRHSAGGCHGRPFWELKLKLWWMKTCEVSSYVAYVMRGIVLPTYSSGDGRRRAGDDEAVWAIPVDDGAASGGAPALGSTLVVAVGARDPHPSGGSVRESLE